MNCHGNQDENKKNDKHSSIKHMLHMLLCCGIPVVIILALPFIAKVSPAIAGLLGVIAPFICPIMMGGMMFMMFKPNKNSKNNTSKISQNSSTVNGDE